MVQRLAVARTFHARVLTVANGVTIPKGGGTRDPTLTANGVWSHTLDLESAEITRHGSL
jgi:hypothetical protein